MARANPPMVASRISMKMPTICADDDLRPAQNKNFNRKIEYGDWGLYDAGVDRP